MQTTLCIYPCYIINMDSKCPPLRMLFAAKTPDILIPGAVLIGFTYSQIWARRVVVRGAVRVEVAIRVHVANR